MPRELGHTLADFVREHVASPEEWQEWEKVRSAKAPGTKPVLPKNPYDEFYHEPLPASKEFLRKVELFRVLIGRAREILLSNEWEASGRGSNADRRDLESADVLNAAIDFDDNRIGSWRHVLIRRARPESNYEMLKHFIEDACGAIGQPRRKANKELIHDLAQTFRKANHSIPAFAAAWEAADLDIKWRRPGP